VASASLPELPQERDWHSLTPVGGRTCGGSPMAGE